MEKPTALDHDAVQAAEAALLTLLDCVTGATGAEKIQINDVEDQLGAPDAVRVLASLPKPLTCTAKMSASAVLKIRCVPKDEAETRFNPAQGAPVTASAAYYPGTDTRILFKSAAGSVQLSHQAFRRWANDYFIAEPYGMSGDYASEIERSQGIAWVINVSGGMAQSSSSLDDLDLPDEFRDMLAAELRRAREGNNFE